MSSAIERICGARLNDLHVLLRIAYSDSPTASRASAGSWYERRLGHLARLAMSQTSATVRTLSISRPLARPRTDVRAARRLAAGRDHNVDRRNAGISRTPQSRAATYSSERRRARDRLPVSGVRSTATSQASASRAATSTSASQIACVDTPRTAERTISTFSCDIARPVSRASGPGGQALGP